MDIENLFIASEDPSLACRVQTRIPGAGTVSSFFAEDDVEGTYTEAVV